MNHLELRSFFYGTLLGDSYLNNGHFSCKQISKDLINFKADIIRKHLPEANVRVTEHESYVDKNNVHHQKYWLLETSSCEYFKKLERLFYPFGKKICPKNVINKLDALGFALWYADEGSTVLVQFNPITKSARSRRVTICTDGFSKEEHDNIIIPELNSVGLNAIYVTRNNHVRVNLKDQKINQQLFLNIGTYFYKYFPSLLYKMDLGYRNESLTNRTYVLSEYESFYTKMSAHLEFVDRLQNKMI